MIWLKVGLALRASRGALGTTRPTRASASQFDKCSDRIVGLPDGTEHGDAVETKGANLRQTPGSDTAQREHGGSAFIRCPRIQ